MKRSWLASSLTFATQFSVLSHAAPRFSVRRPGFDILLTLICVAFWLHIGLDGYWEGRWEPHQDSVVWFPANYEHLLPPYFPAQRSALPSSVFLPSR